MKLIGVKNILTLISLFGLSVHCIGQTNEIKFRVNLNSFSFGGPGSSYETYNKTPVNDPKSPIVDNPYSSNRTISFGTGLSFQRNTKSKLVFGLSVSYDRLLVLIKTTNGIIYDNRIISGDGSNKLTLHYANLHPFVGFILTKNVSSRIEVKLISDICYLLKSREELTFNSNEGVFEFNNNRVHPKNDIRIGLGTSINIKRFGLNLEYLIGIKDFDPYKNSPLVDVDNSIYSNIFRLGLSYMIFKSDGRTKNDL